MIVDEGDASDDDIKAASCSFIHPLPTSVAILLGTHRPSLRGCLEICPLLVNFQDDDQRDCSSARLKVHLAHQGDT